MIALMIALTGLRLIWFYYHAPSAQPVVQNGLLDLRDYHLKTKQTLTLEGEWNFYPNKLVETFQEPHPKQFRNLSKHVSEDPSVQFGTYHIRVIMDESTDLGNLVSIAIPSTKTASALFVNGKLIDQSGHVATDATDHHGKGNAYVSTIAVDSSTIDIMLQVSNFDTSKGIYVGTPVKFGTAKAMAKSKSFEDVLILGLVVILLLHSIYCLLIYLFISRKHIILFFAIGFLFPAIDELLTYNSSLLEWLHFNYAWSFKFKELVYLGAALFLVQIMKNLLKNAMEYKRFHWFTVLYGICALLIITLPLNLLIEINMLFFILYFASFIAVIPLTLKEFLKYKDESFFLALIIVGLISGLLWGLIKAFSGIQIPFYPFDYLFAFLGFAIFWFKRFYRQNEQVIELVHKLKQADKKKDEFLANTSHELRNPLHGIINIAQTILDDKTETLTDRNKENLQLLVRVGKQMNFTLNDILDITRLKEQRIHLHKEKLDLHTVTMGVMDMVRFMTDGKKLNVHHNIPTTFPKVDADENRLIQILFNLLHNAVKFTNKGSITMSATHQKNVATITITDTGIGMNEEMQQRVFEAYNQENTSPIATSSGIGLGLSIVKQLVELHGGTISVESQPDAGSIFSFTIPLVDAPSIGGDQVAASMPTEEKELSIKDSVPIIPHLGTQRAKILVVDDDPVNLRILHHILIANYDVMTATSGREAMTLLDTGEWDLIISDVMMPNMSGYELTKIIRKQFSISELPILLLTARNQPEDIYSGFVAGANDYVSKPMDTLELQARVSALTNLKQSIKEQLRMEAAWLQAQIRPHFLFNTLSTIASLSKLDTTGMVHLLDVFGDYLKRSFDIRNTHPLVALEEELNLARSYLFIEQERFEERLKIEWQLEDHLDFQIPPLSIQPLIENAVHHGVLKRIDGGTICIRITDIETYYEVAVIDDGVGMSEERIQEILGDYHQSGVGIANTDRRLKKLFGKGLRIRSEINCGTSVSFRVPKSG